MAGATVAGLMVLITCVILNRGEAAFKDYTGYITIEIRARPNQQQDVSELIQRENADVWDTNKNGLMHVLVTPEIRTRFLGALDDLGVEWQYHTDVAEQITAEQWAIKERFSSGNPEQLAYNYSDYNPYETIQEELVALSQRCPTGFQCDIYSIGSTYENNSLNTLRIRKTDTPGRKLIWIDSLMHAREWLAGATHMRIANHLISNYSIDPEVTYALNNYDFYILPAINADGYIYTWTTERLWRKNRTPNEGSTCLGTDLNRNYNYAWGGPGADSDPCSNLFRGAYSASELETQALQAQLTELSGSMLAYVTLHTYGKLWMFPWAYTESDGVTCALPPDSGDLRQVAEAAAAAANAAGDVVWTPGSWCEILYVSSGCVQDHAKGANNIKYSFTPELRGESFIVPPSFIDPSFQEVWAALYAMITAIETIEGPQII